MNHVINNLEEHKRRDAKLFQLHNSSFFENWLKYLETKTQIHENLVREIPHNIAVETTIIQEAHVQSSEKIHAFL